MIRFPARSPIFSQGGLTRNVLLALLALTLGPLLIIAALLYQQTQAALTDQINAQLEALALVKQAQISLWTSQRMADLRNLANAPDLGEAARSLKAGAADAAGLTVRLDRFIADNPDYQTLLLIQPMTGRVMAADSAAHAMLDMPVGDALPEAARYQPLFLPPHYDARMNPSAVSLVASAPVIAADQGAQAILVAVLRDDRLLQIIAPAPGLGATGEVYALTQDGYRLGGFITPGLVKPNSAGIQHALIEKASGTGQYLNPHGDLVLGRYVWLPDEQLALLVEQDRAEALAPLNRTAVTLLVITAGVVLLSVIGGVLFTRQLTTPIRALTDGAVRLANGDLTAQVAIRRADEIGTLADTFNRMSADLRVSYQALQTTAATHARQLAATADLSRAAAARLNQEALLTRLADELQARFGYDQVAIFLLEEGGRLATLREATGELGAQLKARGYSVAAGSPSPVGWALAGAARPAGTLTPPQPDQLPGLRSQATLPLRLGERVIGALDLQSLAADAFPAEDLEFLSTLADQIAVAVENSRLFARQQRILDLEALVLSLTGKIHQTFKLDEILENTATELGRALGARRAIVRLYPPARLTSTPQSKPSLSAPTADAATPDSAG